MEKLPKIPKYSIINNKQHTMTEQFKILNYHNRTFIKILPSEAES